MTLPLPPPPPTTTTMKKKKDAFYSSFPPPLPPNNATTGRRKRAARRLGRRRALKEGGGRESGFRNGSERDGHAHLSDGGVGTDVGSGKRDLTSSKNHCPLLPRRILPPQSPPYRPLVIGHRGSSYNVPEHTLASYRLALELGADYIEPDLVPTSDGVLVAVHSIDLNVTTDVANVFPDRYRLNVDLDQPGAGTAATATRRSGYFVMDFTLDEIRHLKVRQRVEDGPARSRLLDWVFGIPTLDDIVDLLWDWNQDVRPLLGTERQLRGGRPGLYVELKDPAWIRQYTMVNWAADDTADEATAQAEEEGVGVAEGGMGTNTGTGTGTEGAVHAYNNNNNNNGTGLDVADLLVESLASNPKAMQLFFNSTLAECSGPDVSYDSYRVPPLVIQCFERSTLAKVYDSIKSDERFLPGGAGLGEDGGGGGTGGAGAADEERLLPPLVLLAGTRQCYDPDFWFDVGEMELGGVGPDKACLLDGYERDGDQGQTSPPQQQQQQQPGDMSGAGAAEEGSGAGIETPTDRAGREFMRQAMEHNLAVHVWTERLEVEFVDRGRFANAEEELAYLFCDLGVDGVFAENVDVGVRVASVGCAGYGYGGEEGGSVGGGGGGGGESSSYPPGSSATSSSSSSTTYQCPPSSSGAGGVGHNYGQGEGNDGDYSYVDQRTALVSVGFGILGFLLGSVGTYCANVRWTRRRMRDGRGRRAMAVPSHVVGEDLDDEVGVGREGTGRVNGLVGGGRRGRSVGGSGSGGRGPQSPELELT